MEKPHPSELQPFEQKDKNFHSNIIIDSRHDFSLLEKKIMYCVINQLKPTPENNEGTYEDLYFKIPVSTFGTDYSFATLKEACDKLLTRSIVGGSYKSKKRAWGFVPFPWYELVDGRLHIMLLKAAVPYFLDLKSKGYTAYKLDIAFSLSSVYSQRLYELLSRFKDTCKWYKVEIEQLKFLLGIDKEKCFSGPNANGHLKARVLEVARLELAAKTDLEFQYSFEKEGRKFVRINFDIFTKKLKNHIEKKEGKEGKQLVLEELNTAQPEQQMVFLHTALSQYKFTDEQKGKIISTPQLALKFVEVHVQLMMGVSKPTVSPSAYIAGILRPLGWS